MKKIALALMVMLAANFTFAQGIEFFHGKFDDALAKAKSENKLLFVDFYTSWCGPCKKMTKEIFTKKEIGDFFNKNFINLKIDAEKGEGPALAKKYKPKGFPTMIFFNPDGTENKRLCGATPNAEFFLNYAKQVTGEVSDFLTMFKKYEQGYRNKDYIREILIQGPVYVSTLEREKQGEWWKKFSEIFSWYLTVKQPHETLNLKDFRLIAQFLDGHNNGNPYVEFVYNNYKKYKKIVPVDELTMFIMRTNNQSIHEYSRRADLRYKEYLEAIRGRLAQAHKDAAAISKNKEDRGDSYIIMKLVADATYAIYGEKDVDKYLDLSLEYKKYMAQFSKTTARDYAATVGNLYAPAKEFITSKQVKRVLKIIKKALKLDPKFSMMIQLKGDYLALLNKKKEAIACYKKVMELTKGGRGESYYKEQMTKKIESLN